MAADVGERRVTLTPHTRRSSHPKADLENMEPNNHGPLVFEIGIMLAILCVPRGSAFIGRSDINTEGIVRRGRQDGSSEAAQTFSFDDPLDEPVPRRQHRRPGARHPWRATEGRRDLDFRIIHISLCNVDQTWPKYG